MDQKDTEMNEKGVSSPTSGVVVQVREKKGALRAAIPYMPFPLAVICLFLNTFVPGLGEYDEPIARLHTNTWPARNNTVLTPEKNGIPSTSYFSARFKLFKFALNILIQFKYIYTTSLQLLFILCNYDLNV